MQKGHTRPPAAFFTSHNPRKVRKPQSRKMIVHSLALSLRCVPGASADTVAPVSGELQCMESPEGGYRSCAGGQYPPAKVKRRLG